LNNLGLLYDRLGNFAAAEQALVEALKIKKEVHGDDHPDTATSLNSLGYLYERMSDYARAEPMYVKALEIHKREYGAEDTRTALSLNNLGALYRAMGDYERAEPLCVAALEMRRKLLGEEHSDTAISRNNLALLYQNKGVYARAEPLFVKALEVNRQLHGDEHEYTALSLHNLGALYQMTGDFAQAEPLCAKALEIRQSLLGDEHPDTAVSRNNLAVLYQNMGDFDRAEPLYQKALDINRKIHGEDHPHTALCLNNLAPLYELMGQFDRAELLSRQALEIYQRHLQRTFDVQSERQQLAFSKTFRVDIDFYLSVAPHAGVDAATMYEPVLLWKGMIYSRRAQWQRLRRDAPKNLAGLFDEFQSLGVRLATLSSATPDPTNRDIWLRQIEELTVARERLEIELARQSVAFRQERKSANCTPQQLQQALPASVGLIDFLEYTHFSPAKERKEGFRAERRLLAFIVRQDRDVVRVDLGAVDALRDAAEAWRRSILAGGGRSGNQPAAGELPPQQFLREQIWLPLEEHLQGAETVLLSPDGLVSRIPLAALPGKMPGTYLLHEMSLAVIPVPQELPRLLESRPATATPDAPSMLLVGDVDFEADPGRVAIAKAAFKPLPGTGREVEVIGRLYQDRFATDKPQELRGPAATEAAFRAQAPRHRYVHVATHGFFADEATPTALDNEDIEPARPSMFIDEGQVRALHPGLLSGLALAGANRSRSIVSIDAKVAEGDQPEDDGILTALEVAGLDFSGVELVVLSACETSLGRVIEGEGVLGLQRAFQSSGALTCVTSLWKVEDRATQVFMEEFYRQLWTVKQDKLTALRKAQLAMLERYDRVQKIIVPRGADVPHDPDAYATNSPYFWAAFILSGDWR
ncbi:MAG: CHAT domain-containing tetratricopeptide repeat protein, partial [Pirellulales bacterium]